MGNDFLDSKFIYKPRFYKTRTWTDFYQLPDSSIKVASYIFHNNYLTHDYLEHIITSTTAKFQYWFLFLITTILTFSYHRSIAHVLTPPGCALTRLFTAWLQNRLFLDITLVFAFSDHACITRFFAFPIRTLAGFFTAWL